MNGQTQAEFADAVISMDQDMLTGPQSHWIKLLREAGPERRQEFFRPLARAWAQLNAKCVSDPNAATPPGAPKLPALDGPPAVTTMFEYDRAKGLGEVVDHTLDGLGLRQRKEFMTILKDELGKALPALDKQEAEVKSILGDSYKGLDFSKLLNNRDGCFALRVARFVRKLAPGLSRNEAGPERRATGQAPATPRRGRLADSRAENAMGMWISVWSPVRSLKMSRWPVSEILRPGGRSQHGEPDPQRAHPSGPTRKSGRG